MIPKDNPGKDLEFCGIFEELFSFVIDFSVYLPFRGVL
jgi:hypothetical protein